MNVSNRSLVSLIACNDPALVAKITAQLRSFKVGINTMRSRGDRDETFGGQGQSWKGSFVGGRLLVEAVTRRPGRMSSLSVTLANTLACPINDNYN
jgi:hypothetical protein